jgi:hypothetical protein
VAVQSEFKEWSETFTKAKNAMEGRAEKISMAFDLLERDLILQGASAVEDKLQDKVPETIQVHFSLITTPPKRCFSWMYVGVDPAQCQYQILDVDW